jgi:hypothetical protein
MGAPFFLPSIFLPNPDRGSQAVDRKMRLPWAIALLHPEMAKSILPVCVGWW